MSLLPQHLPSRIREFICSELGVDDEDVTLDAPLVTSGIIDSVGIVRLAAFVERETGITIPDRDVDIDHFDTIRRIQAYLTRRTAV